MKTAIRRTRQIRTLPVPAIGSQLWFREMKKEIDVRGGVEYVVKRTVVATEWRRKC